MERREALRLLATAAALPLIPGEMYALLRAARAQTATTGAPRTLNSDQYQVVTRMAEIILPETDTPGATAAHVNDFIDLILTEWCTPDERDRFLAGLQDTDARSARSFGKSFLELTPDQQVEIVRVLDTEMATALAKRKEDQDTHGEELFFHSMKHLTLTGYFTSQAGAQKELHFKIITGHYDGCVSATGTQSSK